MVKEASSRESVLQGSGSWKEVIQMELSYQWNTGGGNKDVYIFYRNSDKLSTFIQ